MKTFHPWIAICSTLFLILTFACPLGADEKTEPERDFSGRWKIMLTNKLSRRQVTFVIEQDANKRLRGTMVGNDFPEQKIDGRFEKDNRVFLWGTHYDARTGVRTDYEFRGVYEGEPGQETMKGTSEFIRKRYEFTGERI